MSDLIRELQQLIQINSEYDETTITAAHPVGAGIARGLEWIEEKAKADGFKTTQYDGYALAISYGEQDSRIEAVSHFDVVPATGVWSVPPYAGELIGNRLYGRGTQDMKTALWLTYAALRKIKQEGLILKRQIRVVVGVDEERTMQDIVYYLKHAGLPDFAFTPDSKFPLCLGEKGALSWTLAQSITTRIIALHAGSASNVVCGEVEVELQQEDTDKLVEVLEAHQTKFEFHHGKIRIVGKSAHTSRPQDGENALVLFLKAYVEVFDESWAHQLWEVFSDYTGSGIGLEAYYEPMGFASVCLNVLRIKEQRVEGEIDIRFPTPWTCQAIEEKLTARLSQFSLTLQYEEEAIETTLSNPFVQTCLKVYRECYPHDQSEPFYSGGVTYSKVYQGRCIAYGSHLPFIDEPSLAHQVDEYTTIDHLDELVNLYKQALIECANV